MLQYEFLVQSQVKKRLKFDMNKNMILKQTERAIYGFLTSVFVTQYLELDDNKFTRFRFMFLMMHSFVMPKFNNTPILSVLTMFVM